MLAETLGRTVAELKASMSSREFTGWCAFYEHMRRPIPMHGG